MLATMNMSQSAASLHQNDQLDLEFGRGEHVDVDKVCPGCKLTAVTDDGGLVVAFGQSFFHVDCFKCAKCSNKVTADTNLLLLSDGSPVCANCSYNCNVCRLPILDEAIMTGDDSYHAHCFKCKVCRNRIDELVFAKTSQGIYCMDCHNERMIKIRRHAQKKAEREKIAAAGGTVSSSSRDRRRDNLADTPSSSKTYHTPSTPQSTPRANKESSRRRSQPYVDDAFSPPAGPRAKSAKNSPSHLNLSFPQPQVNIAPPPDTDTPTRPLLAHQTSSSSDVQDRLAAAPTSRREKRRSINPGLVLSNNSLRSPASPPAGSPTLSPLSATFLHQEGNRSPTPPTQNGRDSPRVPSPLRDTFREATSRPTSNGSFHPIGNDAPAYDLTDPIPPRQRTTSSVSRQDEQFTLLRPDSADGSTPTRVRKLSSPSINVSSFPDANGGDSSDVLRPRRSFDERPPARKRGSSSASTKYDRSGNASRNSARADVPHSVESSTDTEPEPDTTSHQRSESDSSLPPAVPPKMERQNSSSVASPIDAVLSPTSLLSPATDNDGDSSYMSSQMDSGSDNDESSPVEQTSHSTFIAPALPPIRFSMNAGDFSDLWSSVDSNNAMKSLNKLSQLEKESDDVPPTPPPTASLESSSTPASDVTVFPPTVKDTEGTPTHPSSYERSISSDSRASMDDGKTESSETTYVDSNGHGNRITLTAPDTAVPRTENSDLVLTRLEEALADAQERGAQQLKLDRGFVEAILKSMHERKGDLLELKGKFDGAKRASKHYIEGLTVAQVEYDKELKARRDAEAEVTRLRVLLSGQAARLTALSGDSRKQELRQQMTKDLHHKLSGLENDLSKLTVDRDMALAEVEEISATKGNSSVNGERPAALSRSLTMRLDTLKSQYQQDLVPLSRQRETLAREISELRAVRDVFLEETTVLNARNEELAQLSTQYARRMDSLPEMSARKPELNGRQSEDRLNGRQSEDRLNGRQSEDRLNGRQSEDRLRGQPMHVLQPTLPSQNLYSSTTSLSDDTHEFKHNPKFSRSEIELPTPSKGKFIKWPGSRAKEASSPAAAEKSSKAHADNHNFQQLSVLRFTRCDHCGDKMWGSQLRCTGCNISVHVRCINQVQVHCSHQSSTRDDSVPPPPSMFGRDLVEQVQADARGGSRAVPIIVEKCIDAVENIALEYEGIYRKTGGSGQSKIITQLFERGDYDSFDLRDSDRFNDICSVTSVLKTYFRSLPVPLFTYDLHDHFMAAVEIKDVSIKNKTLTELVNKLPREHYHTVRELMMHLSRVCQLNERNLMTARNLGVVFGPTLMRSRNPGAEFSDMAGKALSIEWMVENAPQVFGVTQR